MIKNRAFTLAEVLLVVAIIGVVAALTIPNLNKSYDAKVVSAQAKKEYSAIDAAIQNMDIDLLVTGLSTDKAKSEAIVRGNTSGPDPSAVALNEFLPIVSYCGTVVKNCFHESLISPGGSTFLFPPDGNCYYFTLKDNADIGVCYYSKGKDHNAYTKLINTTYQKEPAGIIYMDVNGKAASPNFLGDDISLIHLFKDGSTEFVYLKDYNNPSFYD